MVNSPGMIKEFIIMQTLIQAGFGWKFWDRSTA
jgi:hypothetical protein